MDAITIPCPVPLSVQQRIAEHNKEMVREQAITCRKFRVRMVGPAKPEAATTKPRQEPITTPTAVPPPGKIVTAKNPHRRAIYLP